MKHKIIVIGTPTYKTSLVYDMFKEAGIDLEILEKKDVFLDNSRLWIRPTPTQIIFDDIIKKEQDMKIDTNSRALHEAGHNKRIETFKINAIVRNITNNEKMKKMELFYQNTVLLLSGFKTIKIA